MRLFDRNLSLVLLLFIIPLLFLPKINLIAINERETAGIRIDDFILVLFSALLLLAHAYSNRWLYKIEAYVLIITALGVFSWLINQLLVSLGVLHIHASLFYALRLLEYFLFFYIGAITAKHGDPKRIIKAFFLWNILLMTLQKLSLAGGIISEGYRADVSDRVQGVASFPSEMGLLLNLVFCYMIFESSPSTFLSRFRHPNTRYLGKWFYPYWMFGLFGTFVVFTGNRISIVALIIVFIARISKDFKKPSAGAILKLTAFIPLAFAALGFLIWQTAGVYDRSADLFSFKNIELVEIVWNKIDTSSLPLDNEGGPSQHYDMSWWLRIHKWLFAIKSYVAHPECYLQGLGPGFCGAALDGGILRIIVEYGIIGSFLFWTFFSSLYKLNVQAKWMVISFAINMIFFDAYLSYKAMSLLLFACGSLFAQSHSKHVLTASQPSLCEIGLRT